MVNYCFNWGRLLCHVKQNENTCCAWAGGTIFQLCYFVSFLVLAGNSFWCYYQLRVQCSCGVVLVIWFWWEIVFGVTYVLRVQYSCADVSVLIVAGNSSQNENPF